MLLTVVDSGIRSAPLDVSTGLDAIVQIGVCKDTPVLRVPWSTKRTLSRDVKRAVCLFDSAVMDVDTVVVDERGVGSFPGSDTAAATTKGDL